LTLVGLLLADLIHRGPGRLAPEGRRLGRVPGGPGFHGAEGLLEPDRLAGGLGLLDRVAELLLAERLVAPLAMGAGLHAGQVLLEPGHVGELLVVVAGGPGSFPDGARPGADAGDQPRLGINLGLFGRLHLDEDLGEPVVLALDVLEGGQVIPECDLARGEDVLDALHDPPEPLHLLANLIRLADPLGLQADQDLGAEVPAELRHWRPRARSRP
jgi:hypothetical protein